VLLFTIHLILDENTVYAPESQTARYLSAVLRRRVNRQAPGFRRKTVAL